MGVFGEEGLYKWNTAEPIMTRILDRNIDLEVPKFLILALELEHRNGRSNESTIFNKIRRFLHSLLNLLELSRWAVHIRMSTWQVNHEIYIAPRKTELSSMWSIHLHICIWNSHHYQFLSSFYNSFFSGTMLLHSSGNLIRELFNFLS